MAEFTKSNILSLLESPLSKIIDDCFDWLEDRNVKLDDFQPVSNENDSIIGLMFTLITDKNHKVRVKVTQSDKSIAYYDAYLLGDNKSKEFKTKLNDDEICEFIYEFVEEHYNELIQDEEQLTSDNSDQEEIDSDIESSTKLQIQVSKITGSDQVEISKIYSNYNPVHVYDDIETVLETPQFIQEVTYSEPVCYEINTDGDEFNFNTIVKVESMNTLECILSCAYCTLMALDFKLIENSIDSDDTIEAKKYMIIDQVNFMLRNNQNLFETSFIDLRQIMHNINISDLETISTLDEIIDNYATVLELYKCNFNQDIQMLIDEWILNLRYV